MTYSNFYEMKMSATLAGEIKKIIPSEYLMFKRVRSKLDMILCLFSHFFHSISVIATSCHLANALLQQMLLLFGFLFFIQNWKFVSFTAFLSLNNGDHIMFTYTFVPEFKPSFDNSEKLSTWYDNLEYNISWFTTCPQQLDKTLTVTTTRDLTNPRCSSYCCYIGK